MQVRDQEMAALRRFGILSAMQVSVNFFFFPAGLCIFFPPGLRDFFLLCKKPREKSFKSRGSPESPEKAGEVLKPKDYTLNPINPKP